MKVKDIKKILVVTDTEDYGEKYSYSACYNRIGETKEFKASYSTTSDTEICKICGNWKYGEEDDCTCTENDIIPMSEKDIVDILEYSLDADNTKVYVNNFRVN